MSIRCVALAFCGLWLSLLGTAAGTASAGEAGSPLDVIKQDTEKVLAILKDPALKADDKKAERRKRIEDAVGERFDWPGMAQSSLAIYWKKQTDDQKKDFVALYTRIVRDAYLTKIDRYSGENVKYVGEKVKGSYAVASVKIITTRDTEIPVDYSLKKADDNWLIYDVAVEGVRLVNNYRTQFASMLDGMSYAEFINQLKAKADALNKP